MMLTQKEKGRMKGAKGGGKEKGGEHEDRYGGEAQEDPCDSPMWVLVLS